MLNRISKYNYMQKSSLSLLVVQQVYLFAFDINFSNFSKSFFLWSFCETKSASEMDASFNGLQIKVSMAEQLS